MTDEFKVMYAFGKPYWNQGYATEASQRWVQYAFEKAGLERVVCPHKANAGSVRIGEIRIRN